MLGVEGFYELAQPDWGLVSENISWDWGATHSQATEPQVFRIPHHFLHGLIPVLGEKNLVSKGNAGGFILCRCEGKNSVMELTQEHPGAWGQGQNQLHFLTLTKKVHQQAFLSLIPRAPRAGQAPQSVTVEGSRHSFISGNGVKERAGSGRKSRQGQDEK